MLSTCLAAALIACVVEGQLPPAEARTEPGKESGGRLELIKAAVGHYKIFLGEDRQNHVLVLRATPLLRFGDAVTGVPDGAMFLWTDDKQRPVVIASIYVRNDGVRVDEFQSLHTSGLTAAFDEEVVWHPTHAGIEFKAVPAAEVVATSLPLRLSQMRSIARMFSASVDALKTEDSRQELRLLAQPLYRYASPDDGLLDGAIFAFAKGTNPEVLLLLQAESHEEKTEWRYALARMTSRQCEVRCMDRAIWTAPYTRFPQPPTETYFNRVTRK